MYDLTPLDAYLWFLSAVAFAVAIWTARRRMGLKPKLAILYEESNPFYEVEASRSPDKIERKFRIGIQNVTGFRLRECKLRIRDCHLSDGGPWPLRESFPATLKIQTQLDQERTDRVTLEPYESRTAWLMFANEWGNSIQFQTEPRNMGGSAPQSLFIDVEAMAPNSTPAKQRFYLYQSQGRWHCQRSPN